MVFGAVILVLGVLLAGAHAQCQPGGKYWPSLGKCYYFLTDSLNFKSAEEQCQSVYGGHLVSINSSFESTVINGNANEAFDGEYWIGLIDIYGTGDWTWTDGSNVTYTNWADDFPMHTEGMTCVESSSSTGKWLNTYCTEKVPYEVCEVLLSPPIRTTVSSVHAQCQSGAVYYPDLGKCYYFLTDSLNFKSAEEQCQSLYGGRLVSIKSAFESDIISDNANQMFDGQYWIGLLDMYGSGDWTWMDGTNATYTNWADGFPIKEDGMTCAESSSSTGMWLNTYCTQEEPYGICETLVSQPIRTTGSSTRRISSKSTSRRTLHTSSPSMYSVIGSTTTRSTRSTTTPCTYAGSPCDVLPTSESGNTDSGSTITSTITSGLLILCPLLQAILK